MDVVAEVDDEQIAEVLAAWTGIPVFKLTEEETARLLRMEDELHKRVIGQEQAIKAVSQAIRRTRAGLKDPKRPGGSFIFAGPSGVGKTELSKTLAEFLFGDEDALIQLDMSEFHEKHTVSRLVGAPPGYVGYDEGGQLTEKVRRKPFSRGAVRRDREGPPGRLQHAAAGARGRAADRRSGPHRRLQEHRDHHDDEPRHARHRRSRSASALQAANDTASNYDRMKQKVNDELKQHFRPEFLNRIDDIIVFHQLTEDEIVQIVDLMIARLDARLQEQGHGPRAHAGREGAAGQEGLRPGARRAAAASHDPARDRGHRCRRRSCSASSGPARSWSSTPPPARTARTRSPSAASPSPQRSVTTPTCWPRSAAECAGHRHGDGDAAADHHRGVTALSCRCRGRSRAAP